MKPIYRKVKTTLIDLPDYEGYYDTDVGNIYYNGDSWVTNEGRNVSFEFPSWYLKEIKIPTEEEIDEYISDSKADVEGPISLLVNAGFRSGVEWLLSKLK